MPWRIRLRGLSFSTLLAASPAPEKAEQRLRQLLAAPGAEAVLQRLPEEHLPALLRLLSLSAFLTHFLCRHPEELEQCGREPGAAPPEPCRAERPGVALRRHKYSELLKICFLDLGGKRSCEAVLSDFSKLAEDILGCALEQACGCPPSSWEEQGVPCIFALGKLGAGELNLSSDVDLVYVAPEYGTQPRQMHEQLARAADWCDRMARLLQERDDLGFLYRVDLRLRPWGLQGAPLLTVSAMESYYSVHSRPWERLAWLRARRVSGAAAPGRELLRRMEPFLYLRSLDQKDVQGLVEIKGELSRKQECPASWNVKTGAGGIRELEFFVHILQLLHGAQQPVLRTTSTVRAMQGLVRTGLLSSREAHSLRRAYLFLRRLENFLQLEEEQQTHELPDDSRRRRVLARALFPEVDPDTALERFDERLEWSKALVNSCFSRVLPMAETAPAST